MARFHFITWHSYCLLAIKHKFIFLRAQRKVQRYTQLLKTGNKIMLIAY